MKDESKLAAIEAKLDILIKLEALKVTSLNLPLREVAMRLQRAGLTPKDIAALCDTTANTVSVALSQAKRAAKTNKSKMRG